MRARKKQSRVEDSLKIQEEKKTGKDNSPKTGNKLVANYKQTGSKSSSKSVANYKQSGSKLVAKENVPFEDCFETGSEVVAQLVAEEIANYKQSGSKVIAKTLFKELTGIQKTIINIIYNSCRSIGSKTTPPIAISYLAERSKSSIGTAKNAIIRLCEKGVITKQNFKNGRGGWTEYHLNDHIYNDMLHSESDSKLVANYKQSGSKVVAQPVAELVASPSSSSNSNINTITTEDKNLNEIQIPLVLKEKGFGLSHLKQIISRHEFSVEEIQGFLEAYAFDLQNDQGKKLEARGTNLIGYFFGALKNGGYNTVSRDFKTSEDQAREDQLKALEQRKKIREERENRIFELKFDEWLEKKDREELVKLVPPIGDYLGTIHRSGLKDFFKENILDNMEN